MAAKGRPLERGRIGVMVSRIGPIFMPLTAEISNLSMTHTGLFLSELANVLSVFTSSFYSYAGVCCVVFFFYILVY